MFEKGQQQDSREGVVRSANSRQLITSRSSNPSYCSDSNDQTIRDANDAGGKSNVKEKQLFVDVLLFSSN